MRIFKNAWFCRFTRRERISDDRLKASIARIEKGSVDADLGSGVIKQRIARPGQGRSGGYRSIIIYRKGNKAFFMYGFAKSDFDNIDATDLAAYKKAAKFYLALTENEILKLMYDGELTEIL